MFSFVQVRNKLFRILKWIQRIPKASQLQHGLVFFCNSDGKPIFTVAFSAFVANLCSNNAVGNEKLMNLLCAIERQQNDRSDDSVKLRK